MIPTSTKSLVDNSIYNNIVRACEADLEQHGDNFRGVGWTKKKEYAELRYKIMLDLFLNRHSQPIDLLDCGCGAAHLLEYINEKNLCNISYVGLDLSDKYLALCKSKFPSTTFIKVNILDDDAALPNFDFIVMNGLFNYKGNTKHGDMWSYFCSFIENIWPHAKAGIAFNVMSKYVDWEREDLFHLSIEKVSDFVTKKLSRDFVIRHDYGLFEYTVYVYRNAG